MELVEESYRLTRWFPKSEVFGLVSQIHKAAVSIPANIAEGHGREHLGHYRDHLSVANGSLMELETHFMIAARLAYFKMGELQQVLTLTGDVGRTLAGFTKSLKSTVASNPVLDT